MAYQFHSQCQARQFAEAIIPVPDDYPLKEGLPGDFPKRFSELCRLAKAVYLDMANDPGAYGLMLLSVSETDHNLARDSYRTLHRFADTLSALALSGEMDHCALKVDAEKFRKSIRPVPKYGLILSRLCDFGFLISDFNGSAIDKKAEVFTVAYPDDPHRMETIKIYCECWNALKDDRGDVKLHSKGFHHHFYHFDYKITANLKEIPVLQWIREEADYCCFGKQLKSFSEHFYIQSLKYKDIKFDGEYHYRGNRIARITPTGFAALGRPGWMLSLKLKNMDKYMDFVESLPDTVTRPMTMDSCRFCNFQGAAGEYCKFRLHWTMHAVPHVGCAYSCFFFDDFSPESAALYWKMLQLEYGFDTEAYAEI